jgi:hypothetical protein
VTDSVTDSGAETRDEESVPEPSEDSGEAELAKLEAMVEQLELEVAELEAAELEAIAAPNLPPDVPLAQPILEPETLANPGLNSPSSSPSNLTVAQSSSPIVGGATPPRLLNPAELGWVERNLLLPDREIIIDQSFWLGLRDLGEVAFVATQYGNDLELHVMQANGEVIHTLPANADADSWILWQVQAVSFQEIDFDGSEPDVIVIADHIIGAGPNGSVPFPVTTVYFNQGASFTTDPSVNQLLTERGVATIAQAEAILRGELMFLP